MDIGFDRLVIVLLVGLVVILLVVDTIKNAQHAKTIGDVLAAMQQTITDMQNSTIGTTLAAGLANSVPQDSLNDLYKRADGLEAIVGLNSPIGQLLQRVENYVKTVDSDPGNDPTTKPIVSQTTSVTRRVSQEALNQAVDPETEAGHLGMLPDDRPVDG